MHDLPAFPSLAQIGELIGRHFAPAETARIKRAIDAHPESFTDAVNSEFETMHVLGKETITEAEIAGAFQRAASRAGGES
jgi:hypothetical protein